MKIIVHKGAKEIGGTCIEIQGNSTRILLDLGKPLDPLSKPISIASLKADAILLSHAHLDHYGHVSKLPKTTVFMGALSKEIIEAIAVFTNGRGLRNKVETFVKDVPFKVGEFTITPFLVDHSIAEAFAFLIEKNNGCVLYSGDFRTHGYKAKVMQTLANKIRRPVDVLLMEGTCINRPESVFLQERDVFMDIRSRIADQKTASFLISSATNIDRMKSAYMACSDTGKLFAIDIFTAYMLEIMGRVSSKLPKLTSPHIRIISKKTLAKPYYMKIKGRREFRDFVKRIYNPKHAISAEDIIVDPQKYLVKVAPSHTMLLTQKMSADSAKPAVIYSMWRGYDSFEQFKKMRNIELCYAHTSGHASNVELLAFLKSIKPRQLVPIHTEKPDLFRTIFSRHADVVELDDSGEISL